MKIRDLPPENMIEISLRAMTQMGHEFSSEWTNDWFQPWWVYEYVYTTAIGRALKAAVPGCVFYEYGFYYLAQDSRNAGGRGVANKTYPKGARADIVVLGAEKGYPVFCIEVKPSHLKGKGIAKDIERCKKAVMPKEKSTLNQAAVVFIAHQKRKDKTEGKGGGYLEKFFKKGFQGHKVCGLSKRGGLTESFRELDIQEYNYEDKRGYEWELAENYWKKCDWAAIAIRIQE